MSGSERRSERRSRHRLANKIVRFVFLSCFATGLVVSWVSIQSATVTLRGAIHGQYAVAMASAAERHVEVLTRARVALERAAISPAVTRAAALADPKDLARAGELLAQVLTTSENLDGLTLVSGQGVPLLALGAPVPGRPNARVPEPGYHVLTAADAPLEPWVAVPVTAGTPESGLLLGRIGAARLRGVLASEGRRAGATLRLLDGAGRLIASSNSAEAPGAEVVPLVPILENGGAPLAYTDATGHRVVGTAEPLADVGWYVTGEGPFEVAYVPMLGTAAKVLALNVCVVLLFNLLAYRITAAVVKPIETLCEGARRIAEGQLDVEIPEPKSRDEVGLLTHTFNEMMRKLRQDQIEIERANRALVDRNAGLRQANEVLSQLSITDGLTRLHNHRFFQDHLTREIKRVNRSKEPLSMLLIDIDDFKSLNDRLGHSAGDEVLLGIARVMDSSVRDCDLLARYGGEEFVIVASNTDLLGAYQLAEKIRTSVAESSFILGDSLRPTRITVSIGVAQYRGDRRLFFQATDRALYSAKAQGKNCVVTDEEGLLASGP